MEDNQMWTTKASPSAQEGIDFVEPVDRYT
jgi:hypothetical protein